jgi:quercetin 2,3-dioxygenase
MQTQFFPAGERGLKDIGWLKSHFTFSFSEYAHPAKSAFGSLLVFNDDYVQPGNGFGIHPHSNMEIISVLLQGKMNHIDTLGYKTVIEEGGVQIMSAGSGLRHEEHNIGEEEVNFLQIWISPKLQNITPRYQLRHFSKEKRKGKLTTIVSNEEGAAHCWINQNAKLSLGYYDKGASIPYSFNPTNKCLFVFGIAGSIRIGDTTLQTKDAVGIWNTDNIIIECLEDAHFLVIETVINQK